MFVGIKYGIEDVPGPKASFKDSWKRVEESKTRDRSS